MILFLLQRKTFKIEVPSTNQRIGNGYIIWEAVREIINPDDYGLTEEALYALTKEIMDTSLTMGGDFHLDNIRFFAERFIKSGSIARFKMAHENDF